MANSKTKEMVMRMKNQQIKQKMKEKNVKQWQIAEAIGVSEFTLSRWMRHELEEEKAAMVLEANSTYMVPLYENVSAGFGALAVDSIVDHIPLYFKTRSEAERTICIRVRGDSMSPKIEDGDIVQVRKQETVDSGSLAVVLIDGEEGLIKYVTYEQEAIELRSVNPKYKPLRFVGQETLRIKVVGLVKLILKSATGKPEQVYPITDSEEKTKLLKLINTLDDDSLKELERYLSYLSSRPPRS